MSLTAGTELAPDPGPLAYLKVHLDSTARACGSPTADSAETGLRSPGFPNFEEPVCYRLLANCKRSDTGPSGINCPLFKPSGTFGQLPN
jgi:hypothetical protein